MNMTEEPGRLTLTTDERLQASLHYLVLPDQTWVLEQLFVRPGQSVDLAVQLIKRFTKLATAAQVTVKLLDPFAKKYFAAHSVTNLLAEHQLPVTGAAAVRPIN